MTRFYYERKKKKGKKKEKKGKRGVNKKGSQRAQG